MLQGRDDSGSGTDPPSGSLPQLVTPEGGAERSSLPGPDMGGRAHQDDSGAKRDPSEGRPSGKAASADFTEASASVADLAVPARPAAPVPPLGTSVPGMPQNYPVYQSASPILYACSSADSDPQFVLGSKSSDEQDAISALCSLLDR